MAPPGACCTPGRKERIISAHDRPGPLEEARVCHGITSNNPDKAQMNKPRFYPPTFFYLSLLGMVVLYLLLPIMKIIPSPWNAIGVIFLGAGMALSLMGDGIFRRVGTTIRPFEQSTHLVTESVFRISRNPMYLGFAFLLAGAAFLMGSLTPFFMVPIFIVLIEKLFISTEEKILTEKFGQAYLEYKKQVRRWI
jgi:protein-S-isoprenylcysteine O-methyltransferase Ste14